MAVRLSTLRAGRPLPQSRFLILISVRGWIDPRVIVRLEGLGELKNLMTSSGIQHACSIMPQSTTLPRAPLNSWWMSQEEFVAYFTVLFTDRPMKITNNFSEHILSLGPRFALGIPGIRSINTKGGRTPTASRQATRHETKETKADVSIMTQTGVRRFS
jgi:hypothetical protein